MNLRRASVLSGAIFLALAGNAAVAKDGVFQLERETDQATAKSASQEATQRYLISFEEQGVLAHIRSSAALASVARSNGRVDLQHPQVLAFRAQLARTQGEHVAAICADRYKQAELSEAMARAGVSAPVVWRGQGFRDGGEDAERFRRAAFDGQIRATPSLLLRSAFADTVCLRDPANNIKIAKARSTGRIDAAAATVLAVAEGARQLARPTGKARLSWA